MNQIKTDLGAIILNNSAIQSLIKGAVYEYFATQNNNRIPDLEILDANSIRIEELEQGGIDVNIYAQMTYGALLPEITPNLCAAIQKKVLSLAELELKKINIYIEKISISDKKKSS